MVERYFSIGTQTSSKIIFGGFDYIHALDTLINKRNNATPYDTFEFKIVEIVVRFDKYTREPFDSTIAS